MQNKEIEEIRQCSDIVDLISNYTHLEKKGKEHIGRCPFQDHEDKNPSFSVNEEKQVFYCHGCQEGGDIFKFIDLRESVGFIDSVRTVAERSGVSVPSFSDEERVIFEKKRLAADLLTVTAHFYSEKLSDFPDVKTYLQSRGLTEDYIQEKKIGYAPSEDSGLLKSMEEKGYSITQAVDACVVYEDGKEYYAGCITFPNWHHGRVVYITGRGYPEKSHRKPKKEKVPLEHLFLEENILRKKEVIITEGETDTYTLDQAGFAVCGILGTGGFKDEWTGKFKNVEIVYVSLDGDSEGVAASLKLAERLGAESRIVSVPEFTNSKGKPGTDWNEFFTNKHRSDVESFRQSYRQLMKDAPTLIEYELDRILSEDISPRDITTKLYPALKRIALFENEIERKVNIKIIADKVSKPFGITREAVENEIKRIRKEIEQTRKTRPNRAENNNSLTTEKVIAMLKEQKSITKIHPAQDYVDGKMIFAVRVGNDLCLLNSERRIHPLQDIQRGEGLELVHNLVTTARFSPQGIIRFMENKDIDVDIPDLFHRLHDYINRFIYFQDRAFATLSALWTMGTYVHRIFYSYPYLWINAARGSGKTLLLEILEPVSFNGTLIVDPSEAFIFRDVAYDQVSMFIDEVEGLRNEDKNKYGIVMNILNTGYRKSGRVGRVEKDEKGNFQTRKYSTYSPKMFAGINKISGPLLDRTIRVDILKKKENEKVEEYTAGSVIENFQECLRDDLYVFALLYGDSIAKMYSGEEYKLKGMGHLINRERDIWKPIFLIAHMVDAASDKNSDLIGEMEALSRALVKEKEFEFSEQDEICELLKVFRSCQKEIGAEAIDGQNGRYYLDRTKAFDFFQNTDEFAWLKAKKKTIKTLTNRLGLIKVKSEQMTLIQGCQKARVYTFNLAQIRDMFERHLGRNWDVPASGEDSSVEKD